MTHSVTKSTTKSLVDYYREQGISPVRQNLENIEAHFCRRGGLYRHLGIAPLAIKDRIVLEVGPGSGYNSIFTASLQPARYVLVEGNPRGVKEIQELFRQFADFAAAVEIQECVLEEFTEYGAFDFVFCEGVLGQVPKPAEFLELLGRYVAPRGMLVVTVVDYISTLGDILRRLFAHLYTKPQMTLQEKIAVLLPIFSPQLKLLEGMTRRHDDWITDNLLLPGEIACFFSFPETLETLDKDFEFYSSSPHFVQDWRWYKELLPGQTKLNLRAVECYWENCHNFLNHRELYPPRDAERNRSLQSDCKTFASLVGCYEVERSADNLSNALHVLKTIITQVKEFSRASADALVEAVHILELGDLGQEAFAKSTELGRLFGRAQQYVSLTRKPTPR